MTRKLIALACFFSATAQAASFNSLDALSQAQFKSFAENVSAATQYKAIAPAEPLGVIGLDVGVSVSYTPIDDLEDVFDLASSGDFDTPALILPRVSVQKGLPFGIDVGASVSGAPGTDIKVLGAEVRYALLEGGVASPAVALRGSYSMLQGVDELDMNTMGVDLSISKGFVMLTPYAGAGAIRTTATPNDSVTLEEEVIEETRLFAGVNLNLGMNFVLEADKTGDHTSFSVKAGFRF